MEIQSKEDLFITLDDYAMQDDERDLDFSPTGQKRMRRGGRKGSATVHLSTSLPASWMHGSNSGKASGNEMKVGPGEEFSMAGTVPMAVGALGQSPDGGPGEANQLGGAPYVRLERSRQSARECRARKKIRYQYLEELVNNREKAVLTLRDELSRYMALYQDLESGKVPQNIEALLNENAASGKDDQWKEYSRKAGLTDATKKSLGGSI